MSTSENISLWKKKAEIDYIPPFISLWLSLNAWMRDRYHKAVRDRERLDLLKKGGHRLSERFPQLIRAQDSSGSRFRGSIGELQRALLNAHVPYDNKWLGEIISFDSCPISWNDGLTELESILKSENQKKKIKIDDNLWVEDDIERVFAAYIEIVYQIRCALFHGHLAPEPENERVIRQLYLTLTLTLTMIMEHV